MEEKKKKKVLFLFGAGCEGKGQFGLPSGAEFAKGTILAKGAKELYDKINKSGVYQMDNNKFIHHSASSILYQTIIENDKDGKLKDVLGRELIEQYLNYKKRNIVDSTISNKFKELYKTKIYDVVIDKEESEFTEEVKLFLERANFFSFADSLFNYVRKPELYPKETAKVMKLYYAAYNCIMEKMDLRIEELTADNARAELTIILNNISNKKYFITKLEQYTKVKKEDLYYDMISKFKSNFDINVITTNYTSFAQNMIGLMDDEIAYVHGKLDWFENIKTKEVKILSEHLDDSIIFPFIFVQSGVKPIISPVQLREYVKAMKFLEEADLVIILGYGINSDDEHILNMLRERDKTRGNIIYLKYVEEKTKHEAESVLNQANDNIKELFGDVNSIKVYKSSELIAICNEV